MLYQMNSSSSSFLPFRNNLSIDNKDEAREEEEERKKENSHGK